MRVLAARFADRRGASAALRRLQQKMALQPFDAAVAPLGIPGQADHGEAVLAGRFPDERLSEIRQLVHEEGGEIVANVDERWTRPLRRSGRGAGTGAPTRAW